MIPRLWQRQPGEAPADFMAFIAYLRLKGRRSHRLVATQTGRSLGSIRRLSAKFNWRARVAAFETRLADASQDALDLLASSSRTTADYERLRDAEYQLAQCVLQESRRWLQLASDPRRREVSLRQVCRVIELATKLGRLATGMPTADEPHRRSRREETPGYWTGPSAEEALEKIYGSAASDASESGGSGTPLPDISVDAGVPPEAPLGSPCCRGTEDAPSQPVSSSLKPENCNPPPSAAGQNPIASPENRRRDVWSAWTRIQRRVATARQR